MSDWNSADGLPFSDAYFDIVVLHRTIDRLTAMTRREGRTFAIHTFLAQVSRILSDGGLVIGCVENRYSLDHVLEGVKSLLNRTTDSAENDSLTRRLSVRECDRALAAAGFEGIMLFNMLHGANTPSRIFSIERGWSRSACKRQVEGMRGLVGPFSYAMWRVLAELGVSQYMGAATFFWGRKSC